MILTAVLTLKAHGVWIARIDQGLAALITLYTFVPALSLCVAASRILLQATPAGISVDDIREDITDLQGVISCHHLHVWQLDDTRLIASLRVAVDASGWGRDGSYMLLAREIRLCLHEYGIHSSTIQPEFVQGFAVNSNNGNSDPEGNALSREVRCCTSDDE